MTMRRFLHLCLFIITLYSLNDVWVESSKSVTGTLVQINSSFNYRIYGKKHIENGKSWFKSHGLDMRHGHCGRRATCEPLTFKTCLGAKLPYNYTSLDLIDCETQAQVIERLDKYRALQHVPKCWSVIQPFLCSVFVPKCEPINGEDVVFLPSLEMCRITMEPCRILYNTSFFPSFLRCNDTLFPSKCDNDVREMKFNITGKCLEPLVPADSSTSYYPGIEGCGLQCQDPLYTENEHRQIHKLIGWGGSLCFFSNLFVVLTFFIDWKNANKYPALIVFYINLCFLIACLGWLAQFSPGSREDIVCRKDGTLRYSEPTTGENLSCVIVFILIYYFLIAAMVWFVFLTYAWHLRAIGNVQDRINKKGSYFHLVAWSLPLVLTIIVMALSEIDANSTVGICFVGYVNHSIRISMLLGPLLSVIVIGGYFILRGMIILLSLRNFASVIKSTSASKKIQIIIVRMALCAFSTLIFISITIICHIAEFRHTPQWSTNLKEFIICKISNGPEECKITLRPSIGSLQLHLLCLFGSGIVMSTWCWTPSSVELWKRYIRRKLGKENVDNIKMSKHKVIAQTWAKRKEFEDKGRLSITLHKTYTDPVGLNFDVNDLNSSETNEISSTWANYLPQFVKRRMALTGMGATNSSSQGHRKNSVDSEISFSVRHVSVESRRNSIDSQVSVKIAEMKTKVASRSCAASKHRISSKRHNLTRDWPTVSPKLHQIRKESSTSIESQIIALRKSKQSHKIGFFAHSTKHERAMYKKRYTKEENPELNRLLIKNSKIIMPFAKHDSSLSSCEVKGKHSMDVGDFRGVQTDKNAKDRSQISLNHIENQEALEQVFQTIERAKESSRNMRYSSRHRLSRKLQTGLCSYRQTHRKSNKNKKSNSFSSVPHNDIFKFHISDDLDESMKNFDIAMQVIKHCSDSDLSSRKANSRNSKTSCDVGIQANEFEIVTQNVHAQDNTYESEHNASLIYQAEREYIDTGGQVILNDNLRRNNLTESEKLKLLLLPSN